MRVTVLGKSPSWQDEDGACSGYLVQEGGFTLLLDCGSGVFSKLRGVCDYAEVDAVLITHLHADHFLDLIPFSYALSYGPRRLTAGSARRGDAGAPPDLHLPPGAGEAIRRIVGTWGDEQLVENAFSVIEYDPAAELALGPMRARFCPVPHYTSTYAVDLSAGGARFTFSADCRPNDALVAFARDTDMLLVEATLTEPEMDGARGHLTPREAGEHGRLAAARRLVVTHFSDELDPEWLRAEAAAGYGGPVTLADGGAVYEV